MRHIFPIACLCVLYCSGAIAQQPSTPVTPAPTDKITPPVPLIQSEAVFPDKARTKKLNGRCIVLLDIDVKGMPQNAHIARCTDSVFEKSSLEAATQYRFKPAKTSDGKPVPTPIQIAIAFALLGNHDPIIRIHYSRSTPPGFASSEPGPDGVYPYSTFLDPPTLTAFTDDGYGEAAFSTDGTGACDMTLTIDPKGKPSDPAEAHCAKPGITRLATQSLLDSKYSPGRMNGRPVAVRMSVHLEFVGFFPKQ
jgi:TonB family protein